MWHIPCARFVVAFYNGAASSAQAFNQSKQVTGKVTLGGMVVYWGKKKGGGS